MNGLIILTSMFFVTFIAYNLIKIKIFKYILAPIISILYGFMLFFIGMGISGGLYFALSVMPVIVGLLYIIKHNYINKK